MTTGFSCQWECKGSFSRVSALIWLTKETIFMPPHKVTDWTETHRQHNGFSCSAFFQGRESISDGQAEADGHQWQISAGPLVQEVEGGFPTCSHTFREESHMWSPDTLNISPSWHLTSPHVALSQYLSSIQRTLCVFHHINVFHSSHRRASSAQTQARTHAVCTGI